VLHTRSSIRHAQQEWFIVHPLEVLILEFLAVDALAACAIALGEVSALNHEALNDSVECGALVMKRFPCITDTFLASAEGAEVLSGFGDN
jgi:hypothetical protein